MYIVYDYFRSLRLIYASDEDDEQSAVPANPNTNWNNDALGYFYRGAAYAEQGKKAEAISDFEQCIALSHETAVIQAANYMLQTLR